MQAGCNCCGWIASGQAKKAKKQANEKAIVVGRSDVGEIARRVVLRAAVPS